MPTSYTIDRPHSQSQDLVLIALDASPVGLGAAEVARRLAVVGPNRLPVAPTDGVFKRFFRHFHDVLIYVLIAAAAITAVLGHWVDTSVILGVVVLNAIIGFIQEGKAEQALEGIRRMLSLHAQARRDGTWQKVEAESLVPGDVVRLRSGDRVPADLRLIEVASLRIEESALTGESQASAKRIEPVDVSAGIGDRYCMAFSGCLVSAGRGIGVVTSTGSATELGRINTLISQVETLATPLTRQMATFGKLLSIAILGLAVVMYLVGWIVHDYSTTDLLLAAIGFAVAAIPEGLPAVLTITLAIGVQRMAARKAIIRRLPAVETLGSVTVICSDKTGTLTRNEMTVRDAVTRVGTYEVEGIGYAPTGAILRDDVQASLDRDADLRALVEVMGLCNDAEIAEVDGRWVLTGEPTEGALRTLARKAGLPAAGNERVAVIPFESDSTFMATLNRRNGNESHILMKGAPDRLLDRCRIQRSAAGGSEALNRAFWEEQIDLLSVRGLRVLAAATRRAADGATTLSPEDLDHDMTFLGLVGIADPPRPEAIAAITACHAAGIRVKMITGDHAGTALAIAREMGISAGATAVSGAELEAASDEQLRELVMRHDVFARTSPEHKLRLVMALQANGEVVAMTGDGVNDAPALKRANVGVAMGIKGTESTKEAAEMVLADDNFASIARAIEEGRTTYDNLRKAILFILSTNGAEALDVRAASVFGLVRPLTPVQILWVNLVTAVTLGMALGFDPAEPGVMQRPPRRPGSPIFGSYFLWRLAFVSLLLGGATIGVFLYERAIGAPLDLARTMAVNTLVIGEACYLFNCRYLHATSLRLECLTTNRVVWVTIGALAVLQICFVYAPPMNVWFGTTPLHLHHWLIPLGIGLALFAIVEVEKRLARSWRSTTTPSLPEGGKSPTGAKEDDR